MHIGSTPKRFIRVIAADRRTAGSTAEARAALRTSFVASFSPYAIEGSKLLVPVDVSQNQSWTGTNQGRTWQRDGKQSTLTTDPEPLSSDPSKIVTARPVFEKVE